jgi:phosphoribosylformylglycinamidine synthase subunit PurQ / glutaminase
MRESVRAAVIVFPGANCDHDTFHALRKVLGIDARFVWHKEESLGETDLVVLPGGFSYGDYLRCGAIARFSPIMMDVVRFANAGGAVLGICNGFQVLCEAGLLTGALVKNNQLRFVCRDVFVRVERNDTIFTNQCDTGEILRLPVAHGEGNYIIDEGGLEELQNNKHIILRYCDERGALTEEANPNGSMGNIAGISNAAGNVMGMMPHPERAVEDLLNKTDGKKILESVVQSLLKKNNYKTVG